MDADYADIQVLLTNTPTQAKSLLHNLEQAAKGTGFCLNSDKTEFLCFKQEAVISILNDKSLKLVNHFKYFSSIVNLFAKYWNLWLQNVGYIENRR